MGTLWLGAPRALMMIWTPRVQMYSQKMRWTTQHPIFLVMWLEMLHRLLECVPISRSDLCSSHSLVPPEPRPSPSHEDSCSVVSQVWGMIWLQCRSNNLCPTLQQARGRRAKATEKSGSRCKYPVPRIPLARYTEVKVSKCFILLHLVPEDKCSWSQSWCSSSQGAAGTGHKAIMPIQNSAEKLFSVGFHFCFSKLPYLSLWVVLCSTSREYPSLASKFWQKNGPKNSLWRNFYSTETGQKAEEWLKIE